MLDNHIHKITRKIMDLLLKDEELLKELVIPMFKNYKTEKQITDDGIELKFTMFDTEIDTLLITKEDISSINK